MFFIYIWRDSKSSDNAAIKRLRNLNDIPPERNLITSIESLYNK